MPPEPVTTSIWLEQQLQHALGRIEGLTHDLDHLRELLHSEQTESTKLREDIALLSGRTARHEATLDQVRALQQQIGVLNERFEAESLLRQDRASSGEREQRRDAETQHALESSTARIDAEVRRLTDRLGAFDERLRQVAGDVAHGGIEEGATEARFETLERRVATAITSGHHDDEARAAADAAIPELRAALAATEARAAALNEAQRRIEEELGRFASAAGVEATLAGALDQVRSLRERMETRLLALEAQQADEAQLGAQTAEQRALMLRRVSLQDERLRALETAVEAQRTTLLEHARRAAAVAEEAGKRQMQEIDRQTRAGRELVRRLAERTDEDAQEQPL